jgi:hypothetical protein
LELLFEFTNDLNLCGLVAKDILITVEIVNLALGTLKLLFDFFKFLESYGFFGGRFKQFFLLEIFDLLFDLSSLLEHLLSEFLAVDALIGF